MASAEQPASRTYDQFAELYDQYVGEFDADLPFWRHVTADRNAVVEVGCGTGRILCHLLSSGRRLIGVDVSEEMLKIASNRLLEPVARGQVELHLHDFCVGSLDLGPVTGAIVTYYTFNYILRHPDRFLCHLFTSLASRAVVALDLFDPLPRRQPELDGVTRELTVVLDGAPILLEDTRRMNGAAETREQIYHLPGGDRTVVSRRRYYERAEIEDLLREAGFREVQFAPGYDHGLLASCAQLGDFGSNYTVVGSKP